MNSLIVMRSRSFRCHRVAVMCTALVESTALSCGAHAQPAQPSAHSSGAVEFLGAATIPGDATDLSGLTDMVADMPHNRLGGFGSGIAYSRRDHRYLLLPDRGPADGDSNYRCRVHAFDIRINPAAPADQRVQAQLVQSIMLTTADGTPLIGQRAAIGSHHATGSGAGDKEHAPGDAFAAPRFDSEGVTIAADGSFYISDEYGPFIDHFRADGRRIDRLFPPRRFLNPVASADPVQEMPPRSTTGRQSNRGMEGLTLTPDGQTLVGIMQSPLLQDGGVDDRGKRVGLNIRLLEIALQDGATREFVYRLENASNGVNEVLAINNHEFLVVERDGKGGDDAKFRAVYRINIQGATDVSNIRQLPTDDLPKGGTTDVKPVSKALVLDFMDKAFGLVGKGMPEKIEGLTWGPNLSDGRQLLVVTSDNDFEADTPSLIWAFAVRLE